MNGTSADAEKEPTSASSDTLLDSLALLCALLILLAVIVAGRLVHRKKIRWIGEAGAGLVIGLLVGWLMHLAGVGEAFGSRISFKASLFLLVLMPAIMFHAGYTLDAKPFMRNLGSICMTAFVGTTISTFVIGFMMWGFGALGACYPMPFIYSLTFGAMISATDPVSVLAVFDSLGANPDLYINVFGESVLNDAVAMVMYNTVTRFLSDTVDAGKVFQGIGIFMGIFIGSVLVGLVFGFAAASAFRTGFFSALHEDLPHAGSGQERKQASPELASEPHLQRSSGPGSCGGEQEQQQGPREEQPQPREELEAPEQPADHMAAFHETSLVLVAAYASYMAATALYMSGITAIIATGMMMNAYLMPNMSEEARRRVSVVSQTMAMIFELFSFVYIGLSVLQSQDYQIFYFTLLGLLALAVSRALNIYPLCAIVNFLRPPERRISQKEQLMMWFAGLRGPMAFAISLDAAEKYGEHGRVMKTCTLYLILITVLFNGGLAGYLLNYLKLRKVDQEQEQEQRKLQEQDERSRLLGSEDVSDADACSWKVHVDGSCSEAAAPMGLAGQLLSIPEHQNGAMSASRTMPPRLASLGGASQEAEAVTPGSLARQQSKGMSPRNILGAIREFNSGKFQEKLGRLHNAVSKVLLSSNAVNKMKPVEESPEVALALPRARSMASPRDVAAWCPRPEAPDSELPGALQVGGAPSADGRPAALPRAYSYDSPGSSQALASGVASPKA